MGRRRKTEEPPLSNYWSPPAESRLEKGVGEPVACVTTTFELDAGFFESELLPRFLGLRFDHTENERTFIIEREEALSTTRVSVLVDISKFDPRQTTLQWDQLPIQVPGGIQHGKLTILIWERLVRLIVGSANLTRTGYRTNRELFAVLDFFDGPESVPLILLRDALGFLDTLCNWSRGLPSATKRVQETADRVRARVRRWGNAPRDFSPRERPRVSLVVNRPAQNVTPPLSVADQLIQIWHPRRVVSFTVMTPFVGQRTDIEDLVLSRMKKLAMVRSAQGWLVIPQSPMPAGKTHCVVPLPEHFGKCWKNIFGDGANVLPIPTYVKEVDTRQRELHAKAVLIEGDSHDLLMIGSSNFTPHGMGIGVFNCEVNLVYEDWADAKQEGTSMEDRLGLPVPWDDAVHVEDVIWEEPEQSSEDAPSMKPHLPAFFVWGSYSQRTGEIRIGLDRSQTEPTDWTVNLTGQSHDHAATLFSKSASPADESILIFTLDEKARRAHITALRVVWTTEDNSIYEEFISVSVENRDEDLLPPEEFRNLTVDSIIDCLLSGREPAEWIERENARSKKTPGTDASIESLRSVDTSGYLLYRVRRLGRALAAMSNRIVKTPPTAEAIRYRLLRDPLGPISLAETLCHPTNNGGHPLFEETGYRLYALAEMALSLGYVGKNIRGTSDLDGKNISAFFVEARERLYTLVQQLRIEMGTLPEDMARYLEATFTESGHLLGALKEE